MKKKLLILISLISLNGYSQNTVGVIQNTANSFNGYTLFSANKDTYLINNCGEVVNKWTSAYTSGKTVYLLEDGSILRAGGIENKSIVQPGIGGILEKKDWNNNLIWSYTYSTSTYSQHHDAVPLPNGNILMNVVEVKTALEAVNQGRDPFKLGTTLFNEKLVEIKPTGTNTADIVWEWSFWDHLIQDFDSTKLNFGDVAANPQLLDINFLSIGLPTRSDWIHANSVQYNAQLDQVVVSSPFLSEFYVIDHSTSTSEASSHTGGNYGKGGDFLYRWGNPISYKQGTATDQKLFGQHFVHWIPNGLTDANKILVFNNGKGRPTHYSSVDIINPTVTGGVYGFLGTSYGPLDFDWTYTDPTPTNFYSNILSSAQRLPNGNTLICLGASSHFIEIDSNKNIVWEYISPVHRLGILSQGDDPSINATALIFRAKRFPTNYIAFNGKTLTPGNPIELNPNTGACQILNTKDEIYLNVSLSPNPVKDILTIHATKEILKIEFYNPLGKLVKRTLNSKTINLSSLSPGIYFARIFSDNSITTKKIIKN